jgi:hypothetical protein
MSLLMLHTLMWSYRQQDPLEVEPQSEFIFGMGWRPAISVMHQLLYLGGKSPLVPIRQVVQAPHLVWMTKRIIFAFQPL